MSKPKLSEKRQVELIHNRVLSFFNGDVDKTVSWFKTKHNKLGGTTPIEMIQLGLTDQLYNFIESAKLK